MVASPGDDDGVLVDETHELRSPPTSVPAPLSPLAPDLLYTDKLEWQNFERLVVAMASAVDGAVEARIYGRRGQAQYGLDVVARLTDGRRAGYQAKDWQAFDVADLVAAVEKYTEGRRPFDVARFVVAVACEVTDTAVLERLAELQQEHPNVQIELWDQRQISEMLRILPYVVARFFGEATANLFCDKAALSGGATSTVQSLLTDAIVRGPIASLRLTDTVRRAELLLSTDSGQAARLFGDVARVLEEGGFGAHALRLREAEARALRAAGDTSEEARIRLATGWRHIRAGDPVSARITWRALLADNPELSPEAQRGVAALQAALLVRSEIAHPLSQLAAAIDALETDDHYLADAALLLAEHAVMAREPVWVVERQERLESIAVSMPGTDMGQVLAARLRMCVADATGTWDRLISSARETYTAPIAALVTARHARHLALSGRADEAVERWKLAIERGCPERLNSDVADWLYSLRATQLLYGVPLQDVNEAHRLAQVLRSEGSGSLLPEPYPAKERGLDRMRDRKWRDAYQAFLHYLWRSVVIADFLGELDAHELLGDLFLAAGQGGLAVPHYVHGDAADKLEELAKRIRDQKIDVDTELFTQLPWERRALYAFVNACADLVTDDEGAWWAAKSLEQLKMPSSSPAIGSADQWVAACELFSSLAGLSSAEDAKAFVELADDWIDREPGRYRFTDVAHVNALMNIARAHPELSRTCVAQLLRALLVDQRMATTLLDHGQDLLRSSRDEVEATLSPHAETNVFAALGLVVARADTGPAEQLARRFLDGAVAPRVHQPGSVGIGTNFSIVAMLVRALSPGDAVTFAEAMYAVANDENEHPQNRCDALLALGSVSDRLPAESQMSLLQRVWHFPTAGGGSGLLESLDNPFNVFRVNIQDAPMAAAALRVASALCTSEEDHSMLRQRGLSLLSQPDDVSTNWVCQALAAHVKQMAPLPVDVLASHGNRWIRSLAAVAWASESPREPAVGARLARDTSGDVRRTLASAVANSAEEFAAVVEILEQDPRRSVRLALVRPI